MGSGGRERKAGGKGNRLGTGREEEEEREKRICLPGCHSGREIFDVNSISIWLVRHSSDLSEIKGGSQHLRKSQSWLEIHRDHTSQKFAVARLRT